MARFAAADPQVMGVLQDLVQSMRGLERRLGALEGRLDSAPAPDEGVVAAAPTLTPGAEGKRKRVRTRRKGTASEDQHKAAPKMPKSATSKRGAVPLAKPRAGPPASTVATLKVTIPGNKGAKTRLSARLPPLSA